MENGIFLKEELLEKIKRLKSEHVRKIN